MTNAQRAERARTAFDAVEHDENEPLVQLHDLISDLLHLADALGQDDILHDDGETNGAYVARMGIWHYTEEVAEAEIDKTYNGWSNYPTWAVNLWLSNDEGLHNATCELVTTAAEPADALRGFVQDLANQEYEEASFVQDLLGYALDQVSWIEIANAWLEGGS